jgi:hypothetical protein
LAILVGQQLVAFEYLQVLRAKDLSTILQGQERDFMARPLQATDGMINVKLCGMGFTKADAALLI